LASASALIRGATMSLEEDEQNKAEFLRFFEVVWSGRLPGDEEWMGEILTAFPDLKATPDRVLAAEGGHVVIMFTVTATHQGDYRGVPATGEPITFKGITVAQMENGKIVDEFFVATKMGAVMFGQTLDQD
jgi:predicted ester cyclase